MALIKCPECGKEISDRAGNCPNCGYPISDDYEIERKNSKHGILSIVIGIIAWIALFTAKHWLAFSMPLFIISSVLGIKSDKKYSIAGILISGAGIALSVGMLLICAISVFGK